MFQRWTIKWLQLVNMINTALPQDYRSNQFAARMISNVLATEQFIFIHPYPYCFSDCWANPNYRDQLSCRFNETETP